MACDYLWCNLGFYVRMYYIKMSYILPVKNEIMPNQNL